MGHSCLPGFAVLSLVASFVLSFFPRNVLGEIWDLIKSVSEGFLTSFCISELLCLCYVEILKISSYIHLMLTLYQNPQSLFI